MFGLSWFGWFCIGLTAGYLITNHIVLPLYTQPLHYYWDQWYGDEGVVQVNEAKVGLMQRTMSRAFRWHHLRVPVHAPTSPITSHQHDFLDSRLLAKIIATHGISSPHS